MKEYLIIAAALCLAAAGDAQAGPRRKALKQLQDAAKHGGAGEIVSAPTPVGIPSQPAEVPILSIVAASQQEAMAELVALVGTRNIAHIRYCDSLALCLSQDLRSIDTRNKVPLAIHNPQKMTSEAASVLESALRYKALGIPVVFLEYPRAVFPFQVLEAEDLPREPLILLGALHGDGNSIVRYDVVSNRGRWWLAKTPEDFNAFFLEAIDAHARSEGGEPRVLVIENDAPNAAEPVTGHILRRLQSLEIPVVILKGFDPHIAAAVRTAAARSVVQVYPHDDAQPWGESSGSPAAPSQPSAYSDSIIVGSQGNSAVGMSGHEYQILSRSDGFVTVRDPDTGEMHVLHDPMGVAED